MTKQNDVLAQGATAQPLIKGAVYHLKDYGPAEYVGIDVYGGETTHQFKIGRTNRFLRPDMLTEQLATASRTPAEGERQRCMEILEDVPGETLVDRVNRLKDWHQELSNSYHDAIAEARTERDQSIALVERLTECLGAISRTTFSGSETSDEYARGNHDAHTVCARMARAALSHSSTVSPPAEVK